MKSNSFLRILKLLLLALIFPAISFAQVTLNCESGNRGIDEGNCWDFHSTTYSNSSNYVISGNWSTKSTPLTNTNQNSCYIKTPWMLVGNGNITFQSRLDGSASGVVSKSIVVAYIPYDPSANDGEGTSVQFYTYNFPAFNVTTIRDISVPIPAEIQNSTTTYKFRISYIGQGGSERAYSDNFIFPGTYWSDPSEDCDPLEAIQDADGDGVADVNDNFPNDPYRAFNSYYPSQNNFGSLAFEDGWPNTSDYDMNDLVVDYRFTTVTNASNNVVEVLGKVITRASGASFKNGLGFQLDGINPNKIISVEGNHISEGSIYYFQSNGLEANQQYANCIVFDNFYKVMTHPGTGTGINTSQGAPFVEYDTLNLTIKFINQGVPAAGGTVPISQLTSNKFNFYLVANQQRGAEIHMADFVPSSLANTSLFGTGADDSNPATGKYYKTVNNLPWGINVVQGFDYPLEKAQIDNAYLHFVQWALTSGAEYSNWYMNLPGYRNVSSIY